MFVEDEYGREKRHLLKAMCVDDQKTNVLSLKSSCKNGEFQQHTTNSFWSKMLQLHLCIPWRNKDEWTYRSTL